MLKRFLGNFIPCGLATLVLLVMSAWLKGHYLISQYHPMNWAFYYMPYVPFAAGGIYQILTRRWQSVVGSIGFGVIILVFSWLPFMFADTYVCRTIWRKAKVAIPDCGTAIVSARSYLAGSWSPLPPGLDPVWQVEVKLKDKKPRVFRPDDLRGGMETELFLIRSANRRVLRFNDGYTDTFIDLVQLHKIRSATGRESKLAQIRINSKYGLDVTRE